jgi:hypothetical protein
MNEPAAENRSYVNSDDLERRCLEQLGDAPTVCRPWEPEPDDSDFVWMLDHGFVQPSQP